MDDHFVFTLNISRRLVIKSTLAASAFVLASSEGALAAAQNQDCRNVRIVGYNDMRELLLIIVKRLREENPEFEIELSLPSTKAAPAALLSGYSLLAPMGAEMEQELQLPFLTKWGGLPAEFRLAHASLNPRALSSPTGIFIHQDNPLTSISIEQVRRLFIEKLEHSEVPTWGYLGLQGPWTKLPIKLAGLSEQTAIGRFMLRKLGGTHYVTRLQRFFQSRDVAAAVSADPGSIGIGNLNHAVGDLRPLPIVDHARVERRPVREVIEAGCYPFDRFLLIYVRTDQNGVIDPLAAQILSAAYSTELHDEISHNELGYIPLNPAEQAREQAKLAALSPTTIPARTNVAGSVPSILKPLALRWKASFAQAPVRIDMVMENTFGAPLGKFDRGLNEFLKGRRDFAFLTREIDEDDLSTFRKHHSTEPMVIPIAGGAWDQFGKVDAVVIIVHRDNPISSLDFCQIESVFSQTPQHLRTATYWADLGVSEWEGKLVAIAGCKEWYPHETAKALTIRRRIFGADRGAASWRTIAGIIDQRSVVEQVASNPYAIGFTAVGHLKPGVRVVPIVPTEGGDPLLPTEATISDGSYPIARTIDLVVPTDHTGLPAPAAYRFARALLSTMGQAEIAREGTFRVLTRQGLRNSWTLLSNPICE